MNKKDKVNDMNKLTDDMVIAIWNQMCRELEIEQDMVTYMGEFMHDHIDDESGKLMANVDCMNFSSFDKYVMLNRSGEFYSFSDTDELRGIIAGEHDYMNNLKTEEN